MPSVTNGTLLRQKIFTFDNHTYNACEYSQSSTLYNNNTTSSGINITNVGGTGNSDILISQCNNVDGSYNWCARISSRANEAFINKIHVDSTGVYILCMYQRNISTSLFNADNSLFIRIPVGTGSVFSTLMAKIDLNGKWIYCNTIQSSVSIFPNVDTMLNNFTVVNNDVYVAISCPTNNGNVSLVNTSGTVNFNIPSSSIGDIIVVAKITKNSPYNWTWCGSIRVIGTNNNTNVTYPNIYYNGFDIYVTGTSRRNTALCSGTSTNATFTAIPTSDYIMQFLAKIDTSGTWSGVAFLQTDYTTSYPADGTYITHIGTDLYLSTSLIGNVSFINFSNVLSGLTTIVSSGFAKHIISKISTSGVFAWRSLILGNNSNVQSRDIIVFNNNILTSNYYRSTNVTFYNGNDTQNGITLTGNTLNKTACSFGSINTSGIWNWINHYNLLSSLGDMDVKTQLIIGNNYFYLPNICQGDYNFYNNGSNLSTITITYNSSFGATNVVYPKYDVNGNLIKIPCIKPQVTGGSLISVLQFSSSINDDNLYTSLYFDPGQIGFYLNNTLQTSPNVNITRFNNTSSVSNYNVTLIKFGTVHLPPIPCFAYNNIINYVLPNDIVIDKQGKINNEWININGLLLTKNHLVNIDNKIMYALNYTDNKSYIDDELVHLTSPDGRFIEINGILVATTKNF